jgi:hypothetical protein
VKRAEYGSAINTRALECTVIAVGVFLAADGIRATFAPIWTAIALVFGI